MKTLSLCALTFVALLVLQGCAVNVIVAPNATFIGGDNVGEQNSSQTLFPVFEDGSNDYPER
jgi:hypothetical protein